MRNGQKKGKIIFFIFPIVIFSLIYSFNFHPFFLSLVFERPFTLFLIPTWSFTFFTLSKKKMGSYKITKKLREKILYYSIFITFLIFYLTTFTSNVPMIIAQTPSTTTSIPDYTCGLCTNGPENCPASRVVYENGEEYCCYYKKNECKQVGENPFCVYGSKDKKPEESPGECCKWECISVGWRKISSNTPCTEKPYHSCTVAHCNSSCKCQYDCSKYACQPPEECCTNDDCPFDEPICKNNQCNACVNTLECASEKCCLTEINEGTGCESRGYLSSNKRYLCAPK